MYPPYYTSQVGYERLQAAYARELDGLHPSLCRSMVATRYGDTHTLHGGPPSALPIVLLHGINIHAGVWIAQLNALVHEVRVIAPDVPGFVGRGSWARLPYEGPPLAHWLSDVLDGLGVGSALVVGSSAGGFFALRAAQYAPERVAGLVLMNPTSVAPYRGMYKLTRYPPTVRLLWWMSSRVLARRWIARRMVRAGMGPSQRPSAANIELAYLILKYYRRRIPPPLLTDDDLAAVTAPTWALVGQHEPYSDPRRVLSRLGARLPHLVRADYWPRTGHDINKERPDAVNAYLLDVYAELEHLRQYPQGQATAQAPRYGANPVR